LDKKHGRPHPLKAKDYIYDLVEHKDSKKEAPLQLILTSYVEGVGLADEVVTVAANIGRNQLLLPGLAVYASPENLEKRKQRLSATDNDGKPMHSSIYAELTRKALSRHILNVVVSNENPWTIEPWHIRAAFRRSGFCVPESAIELHRPEMPISGPNKDLEGKQFLVSVKINNTEQTYVRCQIQHWVVPLEGEPPLIEWRDPPIPIFPEDEPIMATLPSLSLK